jgi:hypothetical protein
MPWRQRQQAARLGLHFFRKRAVGGKRHHPVARFGLRDAFANRFDEA